MMPPYARTRASIPWAFLRVCRLTASPRSVVPNGSRRGAPRAQAALPARIMDHPRTVDFIGCEADTLAPGAPPLGIGVFSGMNKRRPFAFVAVVACLVAVPV